MKRVRYFNYRLSVLVHEDADADAAQIEDAVRDRLDPVIEHINEMVGGRAIVELDFVYTGLRPKRLIHPEYVEFLEEGEEE